MRAASLRHSLGNATFMQGDFEKALESYQQGLAVFERSGDTYSAARILQAMGQVHKELGNYGAAADVWDAFGGAEPQERRPHRRGHRAPDNRRGPAAAGRLRPRARGVFEEPRALGEDPRRRQPCGDDVRHRAGVRVAAQLHARRRRGTGRRSTLDQGGQADASVARDLGGLGGAHLATGQPAVALEEYPKSLALREKLKDTPGIIWTLIHIGVLHAFEDRHAEALTVLQRSLDLAVGEKDISAECTATALRARSLLASGDGRGQPGCGARARRRWRRVPNSPTSSRTRG